MALFDCCFVVKGVNEVGSFEGICDRGYESCKLSSVKGRGVDGTG